MTCRVLVGCEMSGIVREAFKRVGWDAWSCDILPSEQPGQHIQGDVLSVINEQWDLAIFHPPCTYLAYVGLRWFKTQPDRMQKALEAFEFFMRLVNAPIPFIAVENPRGFPSKWYRAPDQTIQPWQFGHPMTKATNLWLKNLPPLLYTQIHADPFVNWTEHVHSATERSRTFQGIADAMAIQWSAAIAQDTAHATETRYNICQQTHKQNDLDAANA